MMKPPKIFPERFLSWRCISWVEWVRVDDIGCHFVGGWGGEEEEGFGYFYGFV